MEVVRVISDKIMFTNDSYKHPYLPIVLDGLGLFHEQEHVIRLSGVGVYQWIQTVSGCGQVNINNQSYEVPKGSGMFLAANEPHEYYKIDEEWTVHFVCFNGHMLEDMLEGLGLLDSGVISPKDPDCYIRYFEDMEMAYRNNKHSVLKGSKLLFQLVMDLADDLVEHSQGSPLQTNEQLYRIIAFIENNYMNPIGLMDIADSVGISKQYLCVLFKKAMDETVIDYLTSLRIIKAKTLLIKHRHMKIKNIAVMVGHEDSSYFNYVFKKHEGMTPMEFRHLR